MRKDVLSLILSASLICGLMPVDEWGQKASAASRESSGTVEVSAQRSGVKGADSVSEGAKEATAAASGTFGGEKDETGAVTKEDTHQWSFAESTGVLTISGEGEMPDYTSENYKEAPWYAHAEKIKKIVFTGNVTAVGAYSFNTDYIALEEIDLSGAKSLTGIGANAFYKCSALEIVAGIEQLVTLGSGAFYGTQLKKVSLPNVIELPGNSFFGDSVLTSVDLPNATSIGASAFYKCTALTEVNAPKVTTMGKNTFGYCSSLESISLPELTKMEDYASGMFNYCSSLKDVSLPKLQSINGEGGFQYCTSLEKLELPELTTLGNYLARGCTNLVEVNLPKVPRINYGDFADCYSLVFIRLDEATTLNVSGFTNCYSMQRMYIGGTISSTVSNSVFTNMQATPTVYVKSSTVKSKFSAYTSASGADKVQVASDFSTLKKENALRITQDSYDIETPVAPTIKSNTASAEVTYQYYTDAACQTPVNAEDPTQKPTVPGSYYVKAIGAETDEYFGTTSNIAGFTVYGDVSGEGYIYNNKTNNLTITNASVMETEYASASEVPWNAYRKEIVNIKIADGVTLTKIAPYAFQNMSKMESFTLPDSVTSIGKDAFLSCSKWNAQDVLKENVTSIGDRAFYGCSLISGTMTINTAITEIPGYCFYQCKAITRVVIPDAVTSFGNSCFSYCQALTEIQIPDSVTSFGSGCFSYCTALAAITIPEGITELPSSFLAGCKGITEITIPTSVTTIGENCFQTTGITSIELPENLQSVGSYALSCPYLESVEIPASLTTLPKNLFGTGLKKMIIPGTVTQIEGALFSGCTSLEYVEFEKNEYTTDTLKKVESSQWVNGTQVKWDQMFERVPEDAIIICDGTTYETLLSYAGKGVQETNGWSADILHKPAELIEKLGADYAKEKEAAAQLSEADYDKTLWSSFQTALAEAETLANSGESNYDKIMNKIAAKKSLPVAVKAFLQDTYQKTAAIIESDYDTEADGVDAWYAYLDAVDSAKTMLEKTDATVAEIATCEKTLRQAMADIVKLPTGDAEAALDKVMKAAEALVQTDYTEDSWKTLQNAIKEAQEISKTGTVSQITAAQKKVEDAVSSLQKQSTEGAKADLDKVLQTAAALKESDYTADSWKALQDAIKEAQEISKTGTVSQIAAAQKKVEDAAAALVKATPADPGTSPSPDPGTSSDPKPNATKKPSGNKKVTTKKVKIKQVTIKKVKSPKKKTILVQWKKLAGVTGYQIKIGTNKKITKGKKTYTVKKAKTVKKTIKKLKRKKKYYVKVRAYKIVNGQKKYGTWSKVKKVKVK